MNIIILYKTYIFILTFALSFYYLKHRLKQPFNYGCFFNGWQQVTKSGNCILTGLNTLFSASHRCTKRGKSP